MNSRSLLDHLRNKQWLHYVLVGLTFVLCYLLFGYWNVTGNRGDGYGYGCYDIAPLETEGAANKAFSPDEILSATETPKSDTSSPAHLSRRGATNTNELSHPTFDQRSFPPPPAATENECVAEAASSGPFFQPVDFRPLRVSSGMILDTGQNCGRLPPTCGHRPGFGPP